jgi:sugar lactone lactonase YvrE
MKTRHIRGGLQFAEAPIAMDDGAVLRVEIARGRLHVATLLHGGMRLISPERLRCVGLPLDERSVANLRFGGCDLRTLYVTLCPAAAD